MSGGALDYAYQRLRETVDTIRAHPALPVSWRAFIKHLEQVCNALHDMEWALSGDINLEDADNSIKQALRTPDRVHLLQTMAHDLQHLRTEFEAYAAPLLKKRRGGGKR